MAVSSIFLAALLPEEPISQRIQYQNWGFVLFLACFFILIYAVSVGPKLLVSMIKGLWGGSNRESIFAEQINNELVLKVLLCLQTVILCSVNLFNSYIYQSGGEWDAHFPMFPFIGKTALLILAFFLYKLLSYSLIGNIFFDKDGRREWNDYFISLICLSGFVVFLPTLLLFYIEKMFYLCCFLYAIYLICVIILIFRKIYVLFFHYKTLFFYFILYLCALEIVPLYFLYKGLNYLFIIV